MSGTTTSAEQLHAARARRLPAGIRAALRYVQRAPEVMRRPHGNSFVAAAKRGLLERHEGEPTDTDVRWWRIGGWGIGVREDGSVGRQVPRWYRLTAAGREALAREAEHD